MTPPSITLVIQYAKRLNGLKGTTTTRWVLPDQAYIRIAIIAWELAYKFESPFEGHTHTADEFINSSVYELMYQDAEIDQVIWAATEETGMPFNSTRDILAMNAINQIKLIMKELSPALSQILPIYYRMNSRYCTDSAVITPVGVVITLVDHPCPQN